MLIDLLIVAGMLLAVWVILFSIKRNDQINARRRVGNEILRQRFQYAANRVDAGYKFKDPNPVTDRSRPEERARWLLHHLLSSTQWDQYNRYGWFHAGWYKGWPIFIGDGCVTWGKRRYCVYPKVAAPREDILIAQLLHARTRPGKLLRKANRIN